MNFKTKTFADGLETEGTIFLSGMGKGKCKNCAENMDEAGSPV
jgi:hypothetical protein